MKITIIFFINPDSDVGVTAAEKFSRESWKEILSNLGRIEEEEDVEISSEEDSDNVEGDLGNYESDDNEQESNYVIDQNRNAVRFNGKLEREILMRAMADWILWLILKKWIFVSLINTLRFKTYHFSIFSSCWGS